MLWGLVFAAFTMGLLGGPHCAAMCGAACNAIVRPGVAAGPGGRMLQWQAGRLAGYAVAGAVAGGTVQAAAWLSTQTSALRPVWFLFHLAVLAWGLTLLAMARQPAWVESAGRAVWARVRPAGHVRGGVAMTGALWVFMPCGLLYSALVLASLSGGPLAGAVTMAAFAIGSGVMLGVLPRVLGMLRHARKGIPPGWGPRAAGALLAAMSLWAMGGGLLHRFVEWCIAP